MIWTHVGKDAVLASYIIIWPDIDSAKGFETHVWDGQRDMMIWNMQGGEMKRHLSHW